MGSLHLFSPFSTPKPPCMLPPVRTVILFYNNASDTSLACMTPVFQYLDPSVTLLTVLVSLWADINALPDDTHLHSWVPVQHNSCYWLPIHGHPHFWSSPQCLPRSSYCRGVLLFPWCECCPCWNSGCSGRHLSAGLLSFAVYFQCSAHFASCNALPT